MLMILWGVAVIGTAWIVAWYSGTQNTFGAAIMMTIVGLGVLAIYWVLDRTQK